MENLTYADSHTHLDMARFDNDRDAVIARALAAGVRHILAVGMASTEGRSLDAAFVLAEQHPFIKCTAAVHPHDARAANDALFAQVEERVLSGRAVAVGETGLDYHYAFSPRGEQLAWFRRHLRLAVQAQKVVIVHSREAAEDTYQVLREEAAGRIPILLHCFTYGPAEAERFLEFPDCFLSFPGVVTFRDALLVQESARLTPFSRMLIETDCPYLAPLPYRGKRNEPAYVVEVAKAIALIKQAPLEEIAAATTANACRLFGFGV